MKSDMAYSSVMGKKVIVRGSMMIVDDEMGFVEILETRRLRARMKDDRRRYVRRFLPPDRIGRQRARSKERTAFQLK